MNCERSQRRDWQRHVAIGLGRQLTKAEASEIRKAWSEYNRTREPVNLSAFVDKFSGRVHGWEEK